MSFTIGEYRKETKAFITRGEAKKIRKHIGNAGYITHVLEVSNEKIKDVDQFKIVIYHESLIPGIEEITKKDDFEWRDTIKK